MHMYPHRQGHGLNFVWVPVVELIVQQQATLTAELLISDTIIKCRFNIMDKVLHHKLGHPVLIKLDFLVPAAP